MSTKRQLILTLMCFSLVGCAIEPTSRAQRILPAYPEMVTHCAFLGGVTGVSDVAILPIGTQKAKYQALDKAAQIGATHVVWTGVTHKLKPVANARAYYCDPDKALPDTYEYMSDYLRLHRYPYDEP